MEKTIKEENVVLEQEQPEVKSDVLRGFAVEGAIIAGMPEADRKAKIKGWTYKKVPSLDNPDEEVEKLILEVELVDGSRLDYFPNKTSIKTLRNTHGIRLNSWIDKEFSWECTKAMVNGVKRDILYIKDN